MRGSLRCAVLCGTASVEMAALPKVGSGFAELLVGGGDEVAGEGVEREGAKEVAAEAGVDLIEGADGGLDPGKGEGGGEGVELAAEVDVAKELGGAGGEHEEIFEEEGEGAEESHGLLLAFGAGAVGFGGFEEGGVVGFGGGLAEEQEGVGAGGEEGGEIEREGAAGGSLSEASDKIALRRGQVVAAADEEEFDLCEGKGAETDGGAAAADGGEELAGVFGEQHDVDGGWRLLEDFEQGVGGLLHEGGGGEDEDPAWSLGGKIVGALDEGADLAELDEELGGIGREDKDVRMGLEEDAGFFLVGFAELVAGGDGAGHAGVKIGGLHDAGAVAADAAEGGEGLAVGPEIAGLALALEGEGEEEGEGVFAGAARAGEDERVRQATGGDGHAKLLDGGAAAKKVFEAGGKLEH